MLQFIGHSFIQAVIAALLLTPLALAFVFSQSGLVANGGRIGPFFGLPLAFMFAGIVIPPDFYGNGQVLPNPLSGQPPLV